MRTAFFLVVIGLVATTLIHCKADTALQAEGEEAKVSKAKGHQRMIDTLASLTRSANPQQIYALNTARAAGLEQAIQKESDATKRIQLTYPYASELLASGQLEKATSVLESLIAQLPLQENTKPFFDLLAITYLRKGEVANCLNNHSDESCILPIRSRGQHLDKSGSQQAIELYEKILRAFPDDSQSRWLLNLAHQTLGSYPAGISSDYLIPGLSDGAAQRQFVDRAGHGPLGVDRLSGGVALGDFTGDGLTDIFCTSYGLNDDAQLFVATASGGFTAVDANLGGIKGGLNCQAADYDNDGDLDVLILRGGWFAEAGKFPNSLLQNDGTGRFSDVTYAAGLGDANPTQAAVWSDFDLDGDLDLFVGIEASNANKASSRLYLNDGKGGFSESAKACGIEFIAMVKGVTAGDVNGDGLPDVYVSCLGQPNLLYLNLGVQGGVLRFSESGNDAGVQQPLYSFPTWLFDFDQDGDLDIFASGYDSRVLTDVGGIEALVRLGKETTADRLYLYENDGSGKFTDVAVAQGIARPAFTMGSNFGDGNNDGYPDIYLGTGAPDLRSVVPNLYFENRQGKGYVEKGMLLGLAHIQKGHGVGFADFDNDGDLDIYEVLGGAFEGDNFPNALFENRQENKGNFLRLNLEGKDANRSAIGAKISVYARTKSKEPVVRHAYVNTGSSFGGNELIAHIGLGEATEIDSVSVRWPSQSADIQKINVSINACYKVRQGEAAIKLNQAQWSLEQLGHMHH